LVLTSQKYISKSYDSSYRLPPKPATYALAKKGIRYLREATDLSQTALRNMYKNGTASEPLVEHSLEIFKLCIQLQRQYADQFDIFTKSELSKYDQFLRPLSDLWLRRKKPTDDMPDSYLIEFIEAGTMSWIIRKRIQAHQDFFDEQDEEDYPYVLLIAGNNSTERRTQLLLENVFADFEFWTTTTERLAVSSLEIWKEVFEDDEDDAPILRRL
jgi:hypothetical protein